MSVDWLDELQPSPGPPWHAMGTRALDAAGWLLVDEHLAADLAAKRRLVDERPDVVVASMPGSEEADAEAAAAISAATGRPLATERPSLVAAALGVQEDLCVLRRDPAGRWRLTSGVVCFPSMWKLPDKIGLPLAEVHGPVPAYAGELAERVDRFVDRLRTDRPVWRRNWLVHATDELHLPEPPPEHGEPPVVPDGLWLRSERQTLRRLPRTGAVLFTIRTQQVPLAVLASRPDVGAGLAAAIETWSPELVRYRSAGAWRDRVVAWLRSLGDAPAEAVRSSP